MAEKIKKPTNKEMFVKVREVLENANRPELVDFIDGRIAIVDKKSSNKTQTQNQKDNEILKGVIVDELAKCETPVTITELQTKSEVLADKSNQKLTSLFTQLKKEGKIERVVVGKFAKYAVVAND